MPFWKADEPATRWRRLSRSTRDVIGTVAEDTRGLASTAGHEVLSVTERARSGVADKLAGAAGAVEPSRSRLPRPAVLVAVLAAVAAVVWAARNRSRSAATDEATEADEPAPTTAASPTGAKANGVATTPAGSGRATG
jgi:hypothetical protein